MDYLAPTNSFWQTPAIRIDISPFLLLLIVAAGAGWYYWENR